MEEGIEGSPSYPTTRDASADWSSGAPHGALSFHRNTKDPWSNDLPFIVGDVESCIVYAPLGVPQRVLGESLTPQEAAAWVVVHLPSDCGPAFDGPWPPPENIID
ncbi:DUF6193 family natural product biosynthesis protein [Streptomyces globisporus]|uniref:DUF6193 family natural product biosynthesis protein n=1 Tax=Streptomyces globisporus TaxID=1908 RepID=UPI00099C1723